jgi:hypothetical protein
MELQAVTAASVLLALVGAAVWVQRESERNYLPPLAKVPTGIYRLLEQARKRLFRGSDDVRFTLLVPTPEDPTVLRPFARIGWGGPSATSKARFREGEGLAGKAWATPGAIFVARLGPYENLKEARQAHKDLFGLGEEGASFLSETQLRAQVLVAVSLLGSGRWFKGVLCIDSLDPALVPVDTDHEFWPRLAYLANDLAVALKTPAPPVEEKELNSAKGATLKKVWFEEKVA